MSRVCLLAVCKPAEVLVPLLLKCWVCALTMVLWSLLSCEARGPRRAEVIERSPAGPSEGGGPARTPPQDSSPSFEEFLYQRPAGTVRLHGFLVSEFSPLGSGAQDKIWFALELFLERDRRFLVRYSEFEVQKTDGRVTRVDAGARHETVRGTWKVEGQVLMLEDLGSGTLRFKDGKMGVSLFLSRNVLSKGLAGKRVFLTYQKRERGLD